MFRAVLITFLFISASIGGAFAQDLQDEVKYSARDSMRYDMANRTVYLYGAAKVSFQDISLTADRIRLDLSKNEVSAYGGTDSAGGTFGLPEFTQGGRTIVADSIRYNSDTKQGFIREVRTHEDQLYVSARTSRLQRNKEVHSLGGMLTTCDRPHPHYHFAVSKMIVIPDDKIVAGPAVMKIGKVPTPIAVPFGLFPNHHHEGSAGILVPTWGNSDQFGYFLLNGGYYLPLGDHFDEQLTADIYSRGSWGLRSQTRYRSRYRYNGSLDIQHSTKLNSLPEYPDFSRQRNFFVRWNHVVDPKASLTDRFNASVNLGTSQNFTNNFNSSTVDYLSNTFQSNISWNHLWTGKPYSLTVAAQHSQNTLTHAFAVTLPSLTFNVQRVFPGTWFHGETTGTPKWYDQIGVTWTTQFDNQLNTTEEHLYLQNLPYLLKQTRNGVRHTGAVSTSFKTRAFTVNPSFNITDRTYFSYLRKDYDPESNTVLSDTVPGVRNLFDWNLSTTLTSKLYGMYTFRGKKLKAIRHVITPSATLSYVPGNDTREFGPFGTNGIYAGYSPYDISIYGAPSPNQSGLLALGLVQSVEAKVLDKKPDADGDPQMKKIKLIDYLGINSNYDLLKDSIRWSPVSIAARTQFFNKLDLNLASTWNPYATDALGRNIEMSTRKLDGSLAHLSAATAALGFELKSKRYGQPVGNKPKDDQVVGEADPQKGARINFSLPWHLRVNYSYSVNRAYKERQHTDQQTQSVLFNGDLNILKYWKLGFSSGYDLQAGQWTPTSLNLYWDLHCWEFNFNIIPLGVRKSFMVRINVKASILRDLKYELRKPYGNPNQLLY
ncbi:MAG: putative LPS assembly protein LptD [Flavobacteriales bacterium]